MAQSSLILLACLLVTIGFTVAGSGNHKSTSASNSNETSVETADNTTAIKGVKRRISNRFKLGRNSTNTTTTPTSWASVMPTSCLDGWIAYNQSCYFIGGTPKTWPTAQMDCNAYGGALWVVSNLKEWETISAYSAKSAFNWIGLAWPVGSTSATWTEQNVPANSTETVPVSVELLPWLVPTGSHGYTPSLACVALYAYPDPSTTPYIAYRACSALSNYICKGPSADVAGHSLVANPPRNETAIV